MRHSQSQQKASYDTSAYFHPGARRGRYLVGCYRLGSGPYQHGRFCDNAEIQASVGALGGRLSLPPPQCQPRIQWPANHELYLDATRRPSGYVDPYEATDVLRGTTPREPFLQAHLTRTMSISWPQHMSDVHNLLVDLHFGRGMNVCHAGAVLRMLSWGIDELAGFMHQPIVLPSPPLISTNPSVVKESIHTSVKQHIDMGFRDWEAARSEMRNRRLFAGLVAFVSEGTLGPEHDADGDDIFWSPVVWDRQTGLLHVYDVGGDEKSRRPRLAATSAAWAKILYRLGYSGGFGIHSPPLTTLQPDDSAATGAVSIQILHQVLRGMVGIPCQDLSVALSCPEGTARNVHLGEGSVAMKPEPSPLRHRDWVVTPADEGLGPAKKACRFLIGTLGCHELGLVNPAILTTTSGGAKTGLSFFEGTDPSNQRYVGVDNPFFTSSDHMILDTAEFFTNHGGVQIHSLPGSTLQIGYYHDRDICREDGPDSTPTRTPGTLCSLTGRNESAIPEPPASPQAEQRAQQHLTGSLEVDATDGAIAKSEEVRINSTSTTKTAVLHETIIMGGKPRPRGDKTNIRQPPLHLPAYIMTNVAAMQEGLQKSRLAETVYLPTSNTYATLRPPGLFGLQSWEYVAHR